MDDSHAHLGEEVVAAMRALGARTDLGVVNALYAAAYELARRTGQTPRTIFDVCFNEGPGDEEWRQSLLPFFEAADGSEAAA